MEEQVDRSDDGQPATDRGDRVIDNSAERIASVVADLRKGNVRRIAEDIDDATWNVWLQLLEQPHPVIDATKIFCNFNDSYVGLRPYEDHVLCPPWDVALIGYANSHGNVHVILTITVLHEDRITAIWESTEDHVIDWGRVKWITTALVFLGGRGDHDTEPIRTGGPAHAWTLAIDADGTCQDLRWVHMLPQHSKSLWDGAMLTMLQTINFMNCVNVEIAEPHRPRHEQKRIQRLIGGDSVNEIVVRPISKSRQQGETYFPGDFATPLHTVRGHFARYGPEHGRKLLFGKYSGRFWIPSHAWGTEAAGTREHLYLPEPSQ